MNRWEKAVVAAVWIACGYAALILLLVGIKATEDAAIARNRRRTWS